MVSVSACSSVLAHAEGAGLHGLDPNRTGRIANVPVAHEGTTIAPAVLRQSREAPVTPAATVALAPPPPGVIDEKLLAGEIATRFEPLALCRIDVARNKQLRAEEVEADRLTLRWTIEPTGKVTATEVVGTTAVDADVLHCVKQQMIGWTFSRPSGGPLPVERVFQFRSAQARAASNRPVTTDPRPASAGATFRSVRRSSADARRAWPSRSSRRWACAWICARARRRRRRRSSEEAS